jgi:hypothetical protein
MVERDIQKLLWKHFTKPAKYMFVNIFAFYDLIKDSSGRSGVELDFALIDSRGHVNEYEIKTSKSDFAEEFLKKGHKHDFLKANHPTCPNRYWFACQEGVIKKEDVPDYAGLVVFKKDGSDYKMSIQKKAPLLHDNIYDPRNLFSKVYYKYHQLIDKDLENTRKRIRKADGSKAVEKKRKRKSTKKRFFSVSALRKSKEDNQ